MNRRSINNNRQEIYSPPPKFDQPSQQHRRQHRTSTEFSEHPDNPHHHSKTTMAGSDVAKAEALCDDIRIPRGKQC